jgi:hypothetical protein
MAAETDLFQEEIPWSNQHLFLSYQQDDDVTQTLHTIMFDLRWRPLKGLIETRISLYLL